MISLTSTDWGLLGLGLSLGLGRGDRSRKRGFGGGGGGGGLDRLVVVVVWWLGFVGGGSDVDVGE